MWTRGKSRGRLASAPMRTEPHPGIKGWLPPYHVPHAGLSLSDRPEYVQGIPGRHFTRGGARPALTPMHAPPAVFSFLLEKVKQRPKVGPNAKILVAQMQQPIGIVH